MDESPFVGRVEELRRVLAAWEVAAAGGAALAVIRGEPGVGKSALADAAVAQVRAAGGLVLRGRCDDGAALPYQPFVEILRDLAATAPAVLPRPGPAADALAQLAPELRGFNPPATKADPEMLSGDWMNGIQLYLKGQLNVPHGHAVYVDAPFSLTSISQRQFWGGVDFATLGDGTIQGSSPWTSRTGTSPARAASGPWT